MTSRVVEVAAGPSIRLAAIAVTTGAGQVQDFQHATGAERGPRVPSVFPVRWLASPAVRASLVELAGGGEVLPLHEAQSFTYSRRLEMDRDYHLEVELRRTENPARVTVSAAIFTIDGEICGRFETVLRLVGLERRDDGSSGTAI